MARRAQRAEDQYGRYHFEPVGRDGRTWYDCFNQKNGETYEVTERNCTCPDYETRGKANGYVCKHVHALRLALERGDVCRPADPIPPQRA